MDRFRGLFGSSKNIVIGMLHAKALPGTPKSCHSVQELVDCVCKEASLYKKCGVDALLIENMNDIPYVTARDTGPEVTAVMARICSEVKKTVSSLPCGVQILAGNNFAAVAVALAAGLQFIRAESFVFAHVADEGFMQACAGPLLRYRKNLGADNILVFTDVKKKHSSHALTDDLSVSDTAAAAEFFLSDGIILTGKTTGDSPSAQEVKSVRTYTNLPVLLGSGVTVENVHLYPDIDGVIVGSYFKKSGHWTGELDMEKILRFIDKIKT